MIDFRNWLKQSVWACGIGCWISTVCRIGASRVGARRISASRRIGIRRIGASRRIGARRIGACGISASRRIGACCIGSSWKNFISVYIKSFSCHINITFIKIRVEVLHYSSKFICRSICLNWPTRSYVWEIKRILVIQIIFLSVQARTHRHFSRFQNLLWNHWKLLNLRNSLAVIGAILINLNCYSQVSLSPLVDVLCAQKVRLIFCQIQPSCYFLTCQSFIVIEKTFVWIIWAQTQKRSHICVRIRRQIHIELTRVVTCHVESILGGRWRNKPSFIKITVFSRSDLGIKLGCKK